MAAAQPQFIVLEEHDVVSTEDEVEAYAEWVGIDMEFERDLFDLAGEGLLAKLPAGWQACRASDSDQAEDVFYWYGASQTSVWEHPMDEVYRQKVMEAREQRCVRVITLSLVASEEGLTMLSTNLAGEEVASLSCSDADSYGTLEDEMRKVIGDRAGAVLREAGRHTDRPQLPHAHCGTGPLLTPLV